MSWAMKAWVNEETKRQCKSETPVIMEFLGSVSGLTTRSEIERMSTIYDLEHATLQLPLIR
jgi:hypothetical protein